MKPKTKTPKVASEKEIQSNKDFHLKDCLNSYVPLPPASRTFKVGDLVQYGYHPNCEILNVYEDGRVYEIRTWGTYKRYSSFVEEENTSYVEWTQLLPLSSNTTESNFTQNKDMNINYSNMQLSSLLCTYYSFGMDLEPSYQRDYVWTPEDQVALIDSIFNNRGIGSYILVHLGYGEGKGYEVLDGKQRIKAIIDFFEDKFTYKGKLYSELSNRDRHHFDDIPFPRAEVQNATLEQKIKIFIHVNTTGKHMDQEHIEKVKGMLI